MKKSVKSLLTLLLLLGVTLEMKAADVYLLTAQTINGTVGKYEVPSNHTFAPSTSYGSNVYSLNITSMPATGFSFRIGVSGWSNQMQPTVNDAPLTINEEGTQNPTSYSIDSGCYGSSNAWKVSYTADEYEYLTVNVDITEGSTRRVWIEGKKKTSAGGSDEPVAQSTDVEPGYYLVGNFFSPYNKGGEYNPGGDGATIDYTNHVYFKFEQQNDNSYAFSIPACLTAHAQILAVDDYGNKMVYGPGEVVKLHGAKDYTSASPLTNGAVGTICGTTTKTLVGSETLAEGDNYWDLVTRNDNVTDDDGMYTFSFTLDEGNPSGWQVKHDAKTRVSYILGNMEGATAQPLYNERARDKGDYNNNMYASLYFNGSNGYWGIGYIANDLSNENSDQFKQAQKATPDIHVTQSLEHDKSGTHNKLFFLGNGGYPYSHSDYHDKVWPNQKPFSLNLHGIKRVEYNPTRGVNELSAKDGSYGMSGDILIDGDNQADFTIKTMSMIGDAVEGTYDAKTGNWNYTSKAGDMEYDANERCFSLTISTEGEKYNTPHYFRFVANGDAKQNWGETDNNVTNNKGLARSRYDGADDGNHSCMAGDPNDVQFRKTAREDEEGFGSTTPNKKDILWNRPAGIWTIRFYPELDKAGNDISRYTISGTKVIKIPFTYRVGRFIRTYSNSVAMAPVNDNVKVYEAYKYDTPVNAKKPQSQGTIYLRQLKYIPANMGVVLVGEVPEEGTYSDGAKLNFSLKEAPAEMPLEGDNYTAVWTKADEYVGQEWNNYLVPTVTAIDKLGNAEADDKGNILHRYFGLGNFHSTKYYKENQTGDDYIGFFRLTENGRSGANKAYLSIPANAVVDGGVGAKYGYIDFNGQFLGNGTDDDPNNPSLAKMAVIFDDEDNGGTTTAVSEVKMDTADADASFYTLQGVKVSHPVKGVYIHNGKKFIK
ncbi:hypothetical protein [uncultured Prevotella sp.]|uniref:hypothetical protein n=1 Tax=uncultured Prevotella sp. TaxID=159272 RepID=UPI00204D96F9|nr:hypothetical protein [uncultured Prevotella sp.]DAQ70418.1 MAG TPA: Endo-1,5-alpha-L-arabinanase [Caudoviricetes sp.]